MTRRTKGADKAGRNLTWSLACLFLALVGAFVFLRSPYFAVVEFQVAGNTVLSDEEIVARCGRTHESIFAFDLDKSAALIEANPWVESARLRRKLPGTIIIEVTERSPVAFLPSGDKNWLVDDTGRILGADDGSRDGLVALTGTTGPISEGQFLEASSFGWGLRALSFLGPEVRPKVTEINVQAGECSLILDDGCRVLVGSGDLDCLNRLMGLESILADLDNEGVMAEQIDMRFEKPAVKTRSLIGG